MNNGIFYTEANQEAKQNNISKLFRLAISGKLNDIRKHLEDTGLSINTTLRSKTIMHVLCENQHIQQCLGLLNYPSFDPNIADSDGNYLLTICAKNKNLSLLKALLNLPIISTCNFDETSSEKYNDKLDLVKIALHEDNVALLELVLKHAYVTNTLVNLSSTGIDILVKYARECKSYQLVEYLRLLAQASRTQPKLFQQDSQIYTLVNEGQTISLVEISFVASIKALCKRFDIGIVDDIDKDKVNKKTAKKLVINAERIMQLIPGQFESVDDINPNTIFQRIGGDIDVTANLSYRIIENGKKVLASDEQYRGWAKEAFEKISTAESWKGVSLFAWRSHWVDKQGEVLENQGLSMLEIWFLAILAAIDPKDADDKLLDVEIIQRRRSQLVAALVESQRAYNINEDDYVDNNETESKISCIHGLSIRPFLSLSNLHQCIKMMSDPDAWAAEVARDTLVEILNEDNQLKMQISNVLAKGFLSSDETAFLDKFYADSTPRVETALLEKVRLVENDGYITQAALKNVLRSLKDITLPLVMDYGLDKTSARTYYKDFEPIPDPHRNFKNLVQIKLPNTIDSLYAAIIISARDTFKDDPLLQSILSSTEKLRECVGCILREALLPAKNEPYAAFAKHNLPRQTAHIIRHNFELLYGDLNEESGLQYINAVSKSGVGDNLVLMIIAASLKRNISIYSLTSLHIRDVYSRTLYVASEHPSILICVHCVPDLNARILNFNFVNALLMDTNWPGLYFFVTKIARRNTHDQLMIDNDTFKDFQIMPATRVGGMQQMKIPMDGNCLFNAALISAKAADIPQVKDIYTHLDLRLLVKLRLEAMYLDACNSTNAEIRDQMQSNLLQALNEFQEINDHVWTLEDYIEEIGKSGSWGGDLELQLLSEILETKIVVYSFASDIPYCIGKDNYRYTIYLRYAMHHYNLLISPGKDPSIYMGLTIEQQALSAYAKPRFAFS